jgi:hypothetical protein
MYNRIEGKISEETERIFHNLNLPTNQLVIFSFLFFSFLFFSFLVGMLFNDDLNIEAT